MYMRANRPPNQALHSTAAGAYDHVRRRPVFVSVATLVAAAVVLVGFNLGGVRDRLGGVPRDEAPIRLAVLPFENLTGDPGQEYFSDGLTDEIITQLGRLHPRRLSVIGRTSSMRYKGRDVPLDQIARELGVDYVMEGSARRDGSRVKISASLIQVRDQTQLWSESFERELANILVLQSDVARGVARGLAINLLPAEQNRLAVTRPVNPEAYEGLPEGTVPLADDGAEGTRCGDELHRACCPEGSELCGAVRGDGDGLGPALQQRHHEMPRALPRRKEAILKAQELDPNLPQVQAQLAAIAHYVDWDWPAAELEFRRAMDVDAMDPEVHMWYADYLMNVAGRVDEAIAHARRAVELDPQNSLLRKKILALQKAS
jgi:TolB-like protein